VVDDSTERCRAGGVAVIDDAAGSAPAAESGTATNALEKLRAATQMLSEVSSAQDATDGYCYKVQVSYPTEQKPVRYTVLVGKAAPPTKAKGRRKNNLSFRVVA
jgi:hypothetical protein